MSSEPTKTFDPRNWAFNLESYTDYETAMPYLRMDRLARWNIRKPRLNNDPAPIEKTGGVTSCLYAWGDPAFAPYINKRYVLRLSGASKYKVRFSGSARQIKASKDRIVFAVNKPGVWKILFKGPKGPVPNDFDIQIVKEEWEHLLDDASVPDTDARKIFSPDFLNQLQEDRPQSLRFMKPQSTEDQDIRKRAVRERLLPPLVYMATIISNVFDPRRIIIGGSVLEPFYNYLIEPFEQQLREKAWIKGPSEICWYRTEDMDGAYGSILHSGDRIVQGIIDQIDLDHHQ